MPSEISVQGAVWAGFETAWEEFATVVAQEADPGAQLVAYLHGQQVVDVWAGEGVTGDSLDAPYSI